MSNAIDVKCICRSPSSFITLEMLSLTRKQEIVRLRRIQNSLKKQTWNAPVRCSLQSNDWDNNAIDRSCNFFSKSRFVVCFQVWEWYVNSKIIWRLNCLSNRVMKVILQFLPFFFSGCFQCASLLPRWDDTVLCWDWLSLCASDRNPLTLNQICRIDLCIQHTNAHTMGTTFSQNLLKVKLKVVLLFVLISQFCVCLQHVWFCVRCRWLCSAWTWSHRRKTTK